MSKKWEEEAAYYDAHQDDHEMWGDAVEAPVTAPRGGLAVSVTVRFSPQDADALRRVARARHQTYSEVVRKAVQEYTRPGQELRPGGNYSGLGSTAVDFEQRGTETLSSVMELIRR